MLILLSGPNNSGKSLFAEKIASGLPGDRFYIATMRPCTDDNVRRIAKHRRQRSGLGFRTLECPYRVGDAPVSAGSAARPEGAPIGDAPVSSGCVVLLEDVSNLLGNVLFERGGSVRDVLEDILQLRDRCSVLIAVTISGLLPDGYDEETAGYIGGLNEINGELLALADVAVDMREQVPVCVKGNLCSLGVSV